MKAVRCVGFFLLCALLYGATANAQLSPRLQQLRNITFDHITTEQGLASDAAEAIIEDSRGFMWFGTQAGLCRYDGYTMLVYRRDELDSTSISDSYINDRTILEDRSRKTIWIGCKFGLNAYDISSGKFTRFTADSVDPSSLSDSYIKSICQDRTGRLWIGTEKGLNEMTVDSSGQVKFIRYLNDPKDTTSIGGNNVTAVCEGDDGVIWVGAGRGMSRFDALTKRFTRVLFTGKDAPDQSANRVTAICRDGKSILWVATLGGVIRYDIRTASFKQIRYDPVNPYSPSSNNVTSLSIDERGILWAGTNDAGLNALDTQTGQCVRFSLNLTDAGGLSNNWVTDLYRDQRGSIWIATLNGGINKFERGKRQAIHIRKEPGNTSGLSSDDVWEMVEDSRGAVWVGTSEGLNVYDRRTGQFSHYRHDPFNEGSLSHPHAGSVYNDVDGSILVGGPEGLTRIDPLTGSITRHNLKPVPPRNNSFGRISAIYRDPKGTLWVATSNGPKIVHLKENRFDDFAYYKYTTQILGDRDGRTLWVATDGDGLLKIDLKTQQVKQFVNSPHDPTSISHNTVCALREDPNEPETILWLVTFGGGLNRFDKSAGTFTRFMQTEGLADNQTVSMVFDGRGNLWLGTVAGLSRFDPKTKIFRNYDARDGITNGEANQRGLLMVSTGEIFAGTPKGLTIFHPDSLRDNTHVPAIVLTDFRITNKSILPGGSGSPLTESITETKHITLSYRDNMISFEFAALDYVMPEKNQYAYKLEGFDRNWIRPENVRTATYTNLDPGEYIFRVKGSNNDGIWNEEGASLMISITPPWWKTTWAYIAYVIIVGTILYSLYRIRIRRLQLSHQVQIEHLEAEKMHELDRMKSRFFANISHECRTPLTLVLGPLEKIKSNVMDEETQHALGMVKRNAYQLLSLINQLLDLSKLEAGAMKLHARPGNIVPVVRGVAYSFESSAGLRKIDLHVSASQEEIQVYFDKDKLEKILTNLISNAFKFSQEGGQVEVRVTHSPTLAVTESAAEGTREGETLTITVSDTGIGIPEDHLPHIFDRFYQVDNSATREQGGTGIGLALVKELVDLHHGTIQVKSQSRVGTEFTVSLPLGKGHLTPEEILPGPAEEEAETVLHDAISEITESSQERGTNEHHDGQKHLVLIVEDNGDVREYIKDNLPASYSAIEARDGAEGIEKARDTIPDLIISDVMMPKKDGYELCRTLKSDEKTSHIPIILLTARAAGEDKIEGLETGADDYLIKPFEPRELVVRMKNLIDLRRKLRERFTVAIPLNPGEIAVTSMDDAFLKKVMVAMEQHMDDELFHTESLADEVGMSRVQLHRKLTALTNQSPGEFIRYLRLHRAMELLQKGFGTVSEIGYSVGFSDPSNFSKCFHKQFGKRPSDVKKRLNAG